MEEVEFFAENILHNNGILMSFNRLFNQKFGSIPMLREGRRINMLRFNLIKTINPPLRNNVLNDTLTETYMNCLFGLVYSLLLNNNVVNGSIISDIFLDLIDSYSYDDRKTTVFNIIIREINEAAYCYAKNTQRLQIEMGETLYYSFFNEEFFASATSSIVQHLPRTGDTIFLNRNPDGSVSQINLIELKRQRRGIMDFFVNADSSITTKTANPEIINNVNGIPVLKRLGAYQLRDAVRTADSIIIPYQIIEKINDRPRSQFRNITLYGRPDTTITIPVIAIDFMHNIITTMLRQCKYRINDRQSVYINVPSHLTSEMVINNFTQLTRQQR